jgi:hypothetical protein
VPLWLKQFIFTAFDVLPRYCLCLGFLTAVVVGALGWFLGGFRLTNASWVLMTQGWLETSAVAFTAPSWY